MRRERVRRGEAGAPGYSAPRHQPAAKQRHMGIGLRIFTGILGVIISPVVLLVSLFKPSMKVGRQWVVSYTIVVILCAGVAWASSTAVDSWSLEALSTLSHYPSARVETKDLPFSSIINHEALRNGLDPFLVAAIMSQGSGYQAEAVSWRGAKGLMQVRPEVWRSFMPQSHCKGDHPAPACSSECIFNAESNIRIGSAYLRYLIDTNDGDIFAALASYNAEIPSADGDAPMASAGAADGAPADSSAGAINVACKPYANIVQAWVNMRGNAGEKNIRIVVATRRVLRLSSWAAIGLLAFFLIWASIRYPRAGARQD